jgi:DNA-binding LytR/AlgR family response regulator
MTTSSRPIRAFIVDDERLAVDRLSRLLIDTGRVDVVGSITDPEEALVRLRQQSVDVLFLDIQMAGLSGFDLAARVEGDTAIVFTTAYEQYALDALALNSIDYLLKPVDPREIERALDKLERLTRVHRVDLRALARELAAELTTTPKLERIASRLGDRTIVLDVARISHATARDKSTFVAYGGRDYMVDYTLTELERRLDPHRFIRVHRAALVNTTFIAELYPGIDEGLLIRLKDERRTEIAVARDRVKTLKVRLGV